MVGQPANNISRILHSHIHLTGIDVDTIYIEYTGITFIHGDQHVLGILFQPIDQADLHFLERNELFLTRPINVHCIETVVFIACFVLHISYTVTARPQITADVSFRGLCDTGHLVFSYVQDMNIQSIFPGLNPGHVCSLWR